ncbi:Stf0 family sulfotransferase [Roseovarius salis]|uniref:Stf0 family sulfotransferase n=1 Tax=Roseovarius salis TaxID=3376063 RepID=UPI0037CB5F56
MPTNVHEKHISAALESCVYSGGNPVDKTLVLLGFVNRSGSTYLGDLLSKLDGFSGFKEQLNHKAVLNTCARKRIKTFPEYIHHIASETEGSVFGIKASAMQARMLFRWRIPEMFSRTRMIHIIRNDVVSQAVSLHVAQHTGQWTSLQDAASSSAPYDFKHIKGRIDGINNQNGEIRLTASVLGIPVHTIVYEDFVADQDAGIEGVSRFLGVEASAGGVHAQSSYKKQRSQEKSDMVDRFKRELAELWLQEGDA